MSTVHDAAHGGAHDSDHAGHGHEDLGFIRRYVFSMDHKVIGIQYGVTFVALFLLSGLAAMGIRYEMMQPGMQLFTEDQYNSVMSFHGIGMIAVAVAIMMGAFGNYVVPIMIGARDMAFPRVNALSYWLVPPVAVMLVIALLMGGWDTGWTAYPPLAVLTKPGQTLFNLAVTTFGPAVDAELVVARVRAVHERVKGTARDGRSYSAGDPHLLRWVHICEVDSFLAAHRVYGAEPRRLPLSIGDPTIVTGSTATVSMHDLFGLYLQGGRIDVGFLGGAQIDRFGNLNTTVIGDYTAPKTRLPGSGGACEIAINAKEIMVIMRQSTRSFVGRLDFRTSPGHLGGATASAQIRTEQGWGGSGPSVVVTDLAVYGFNRDGEMELRSIHPGSTLDEVKATIGWELKVPADVPETPAPTAEELRLIREELDPSGAYV